MTSSLFRNRTDTRHGASSKPGELIVYTPVGYRMLAAFVLVAAAALIAYLWVGKYERVETAIGFLTTSEPAIDLHPPSAGQVLSLSVKEGQQVKSGDILATIGPQYSNEVGRDVALMTAEQLKGRMLFTRARIAALESAAQTQARAARTSIAQFHDQRRSLEAKQALQAQILASHRGAMGRYGSLHEKGYMSDVELERRRQIHLGEEQRAADIEISLASISSQISQAQEQVRLVEDNRAGQVAALEDTYSQIETELRSVEAGWRGTVKSPVNGVVTSIRARKGQLATPTNALLSISPSGSPEFVETYASSSAIGLIEVGDDARVAVDAFPFQKFGLVEGRIETISRYPISAGDPSLPFRSDQPVFRIRIRLDSASLSAFSAKSFIRNGMSAKVRLISERRRLIDYIISPITSVTAR